MNWITPVRFTGRVRPDRIEEYRQRHEDVWPPMRQALAEADWANCSLTAHVFRRRCPWLT